MSKVLLPSAYSNDAPPSIPFQGERDLTPMEAEANAEKLKQEAKRIEQETREMKIRNDKAERSYLLYTIGYSLVGFILGGIVGFFVVLNIYT